MISSIGFPGPVSTHGAHGLDYIPQPPVFRVDTTDQMGQSKIIYLNKIKGNNDNQKGQTYHPFADKLSPFEEWKHTMTTVMETFFQFMLHDICWNCCYYTWHAILYVLVLLPAAALGLIIEYLRQLKNKCLKKKDKEESSPFKQIPNSPK